MTQPTVTDADRKAAAPYSKSYYKGEACDVVQAFASHRLLGREELRADWANVLAATHAEGERAGLEKAAKTMDAENDVEFEYAARTIRNLIGKP